MYQQQCKATPPSNNEDQELTLQNLLQVALGKNGKPLTSSSIAMLYGVIKSIMKKLNCEDEIVTIAGVKSKELRELLCEANPCAMQCDEHLNVLTKELDKLEELEQQIEQMESKLCKHLDIKFEPTVSKFDERPFVLDDDSTTTRPGQDMPPTFQLRKSSKPTTLHRETVIAFDENLSGWDGQQIRYGVSPTVTIKSIPSRWVFSPVDSKHIPEVLQTHDDDFVDIVDTAADCMVQKVNELKETFSAFKRRVEDNEGWWELTKTCEEANGKVTEQPIEIETEAETEIEAEASAETAAEATKSTSETADVFCCYVPCEDVFTIPTKENELPRALLKSTAFMQNFAELTRAPLRRRMRKIECNFDDLVTNLTNWIHEVSNRTIDSGLYDRSLTKLAELGYIVTTNQSVVMDTLAGMQEIFDMKLDKCEIISVKEEIAAMLSQSEKGSSAVVQQFAQSRAAAFTLQTAAERRQSEARKKLPANLQKCATCAAGICELNVRESQLLRRISQFTKSDMISLMERQTTASKLIRLTNSSGVLREMNKRLSTMHRVKSVTSTPSQRIFQDISRRYSGKSVLKGKIGDTSSSNAGDEIENQQQKHA